MIAFISRLFTLFFLFVGAAFGLLFLIWGQPNEKVWQPLWQQTYDAIPLGGVIVISLFALSLLIAGWISVTARIKKPRQHAL